MKTTITTTSEENNNNDDGYDDDDYNYNSSDCDDEETRMMKVLGLPHDGFHVRNKAKNQHHHHHDDDDISERLDPIQEKRSMLPSANLLSSSSSSLLTDCSSKRLHWQALDLTWVHEAKTLLRPDLLSVITRSLRHHHTLGCSNKNKDTAYTSSSVYSPAPMSGGVGQGDDHRGGGGGGGAILLLE